MRRFVAYILLTFATLVGGGYAYSAPMLLLEKPSSPELRLEADFTTLFDNTEYASMKGVSSGTLFGARLTPKVGIEWQYRNQLMVGADLYQDFGHDKFLSDAKLQLYYAFQDYNAKVYAGIFPRSAMKGLRSPLLFDPAYCYHNNSIAGVLARYDDSKTPSYVEFAMDYTGMRSFDTRESFAIMSSGMHSLNAQFINGRIAYGYDFYMGHYAKDYNPETVDGVVDNILLTPYVELECRNFGVLIGQKWMTLNVRLSYIQSLQRDRINENVWKLVFDLGELPERVAIEHKLTITPIGRVYRLDKVDDVIELDRCCGRLRGAGCSGCYDTRRLARAIASCELLVHTATERVAQETRKHRIKVECRVLDQRLRYGDDRCTICVGLERYRAERRSSLGALVVLRHDGCLGTGVVDCRHDKVATMRGVDDSSRLEHTSVGFECNLNLRG